MRSIHDMMSLEGRVALVTGGTGWLGSAICETLSELGATVIAASRGTSEQFTSIEHYKIDFTDIDDDPDYPHPDGGDKIDRMLKHISEKHGHVNILVNNMCEWTKSVDFMKTDTVDIEDNFTLNVTPHLILTQRVAKHMLRGDSIINIASMYGKVSPDLKMYQGEGGNALMYGAAKAALIQSTKYLAGLLGQQGIRVNSISPGPFPRPGALNGKGWFRDELNRRTMLDRVADREELKGAVALLATDLGSYITGEDIAVDGGWTAY